MDSYFYYYQFKIPKFENFNWLVIRTKNQYIHAISPTSFYVYSENKENNQNLSWNISLTVISVVNTLLIVFILFKILTFKKQLSSDEINNKLN